MSATLPMNGWMDERMDVLLWVVGCWKLTKNCSHIISDISISGCLPHSGISQRFNLDADSPSVLEKDI